MKRSTARSDERASVGAVGYGLVVVGTSWGGLAALRMLLTSLPTTFDIPTAIVQHRHRDSDMLLARFLQDHTRLRVSEVEDKQSIEPGGLYIAPSNYHMLVEEGHFSLSTEAPLRYSRPSIDIALASAAKAYGHRAVGVVLTGASDDGAAGLRDVADAGGLAVIQEPGTAEVAAMPLAALSAVPNARVFPIERIGPFLGTLPTRQQRAQGTA